MSVLRYTLDENNKPVAAVDLHQWAEWFEKSNRVVRRTIIKITQPTTQPTTQLSLFVEDITVSTVFLGLDHSFGRHGPPVLWETLVFGGPNADDMERYASMEEAVLGHFRMVETVAAALDELHLQYTLTEERK